MEKPEVSLKNLLKVNPFALFFQPTIFLLVATGLGYAFGYFYLLVMGRALGPELFGKLGALVSIFYITSLVGQALCETIASRIAGVKGQKGELLALNTFFAIVKKVWLLCLLPPLVIAILAGPVRSFFYIDSAMPVFYLALAMFAVLVLDILLGLQQGLQQFREMGMTGYITAQGLKLGLGALFIWLGWGLDGAMASLFASTAAAVVVGFLFLRDKFLKHLRAPGVDGEGLWPILYPTLMVAVFLSVPASVDVMLVTHYFSASESGIYNAVATLGKVVVFLPMAVSFIMLPRASEKNAMGHSTVRLLFSAMGLTLALSGAVCLVCWSQPDLLVSVFFGAEYLEAARLLGLYVGAMLLFSLNVVVMHYSLAVHSYRTMLLVDIVTLLQIAAIVVFHQAMPQVVQILLWGNAAGLVGGLLVLVLHKKVGVSKI